MMFYALEFSNQGCAPLQGAQPIELGSANSASDALQRACHILSAIPRTDFIIQRQNRRWCVLTHTELATFI